MFLLVVIAIVVIICVISKSNSSTSNTAPLHPPVQKKVLIDTDLVNSVIAIQETAINIARSNRCGGFLRISVFSNKGQAGIELDHFYHTNKPNSYLDNTEVVMFYAARERKIDSYSDFSEGFWLHIFRLGQDHPLFL